tara:strand:+ start:275 stop:523 length:249 start_codon:yes stop_codon:yes gene_type:complete
MPDATETLTVFFPMEVNQKQVEAQYITAKKEPLIATLRMDKPWSFKYFDGEHNCVLGRKKTFNPKATTIMDWFKIVIKKGLL